jgi:hypothetical protein
MEVLNNAPNILHFSGHGNLGILCFEDKNGNSAIVPAAAIEGLVKLSESVDCLVLNSCYSDSVAQKVQPHVRAVIGCSVSIGDDAAISFSKAFYRAISHGNPYRRAFELALNELQIAGMEEDAKIYTFLDGGKQ